MATTSVSIRSATAILPATLLSPPHRGSSGLIVIAHGTDGFEDNQRGPWKTMILGYAEEMEKLGFFVLVPEFFATTSTAAGDAALRGMMQHRARWASGLSDCVTYARSLPGVDPTRIGLLGFSLGGHLCLYIRGVTQPKVLVEYFAPTLDGIGPPGHVPRAQIHHGTHDVTPGTSFANAGVIEKTLQSEGTSVTLFPYEGAGHGFSGSDAANQKANALSKTRTLAFFEKQL